jgi:hypothetical protein
MFKAPEQFRVHSGRLKSLEADGNNGYFRFDRGRTEFHCIVADGSGWEHVSIHCTVQNLQRTPTWAEMCWIKDKFWGEDDCVVQYHPSKQEYVNMHKHTLHLWKPTRQTIPIPDKLMVGV